MRQAIYNPLAVRYRSLEALGYPRHWLGSDGTVWTWQGGRIVCLRLNCVGRDHHVALLKRRRQGWNWPVELLLWHYFHQPQLAVTRTALGTQGGLASGGTLVSSLTLAAGDLLVVIAGIAIASSTITASWNSLALSTGPSSTGTFQTGTMLYRNITAGATSNLTVSFTGTGSTLQCVASKAQGLTSWLTDATGHGASGMTTTPSSGATGTNAGAGIVFGGVWMFTGPLGTWSNSFTDGQSAGSTALISEGYIAPTTAVAYTAAKTGGANVAWSALCQAFKGTTAASIFNPYYYRHLAGGAI